MREFSEVVQVITGHNFLQRHNVIVLEEFGGVLKKQIIKMQDS